MRQVERGFIVLNIMGTMYDITDYDKRAFNVQFKRNKLS